MNTKLSRHLAALGLLLSATLNATAEDIPKGWTSFRNGGSSRVVGELPTQWAADTNIAWQTETDGYGQSAPVILEDQIIVASVIGEQKEQCAVTAYSLTDGKQLWQHRFDAAHHAPSSYMMSRAAPTPVVDQQAVYAFFESGDLVAVDLSGKSLWHRDLTADYGEFQNNHGLGSSPAQTADLVVLNIEHKGPSVLLALDKKTGQTTWKADRPSGSSWTSPIVVGEGSTQQVVVSSGGDLSGYDLHDGQKLWSLEGLEGNSVPSPCAVGDFIFVGARIPEFGSAEEAAKSNLCVRITGDDAQPYELCWRAAKAVSDYASPVVDGEHVYFLNKVGVLYCVDAMSGETIYQQRLRSECWATPIVTETGIYFFGKDGTTRIVRRGREFEVLATNNLWDTNDPPKPEHYKEATGRGHGHGGSAEGESPGNAAAQGRDRSAGMLARLMEGDANKDGILQAEELSADFQPMLKRVDTNGDGALDQAELKAMADSFAKRREGSQAGSRDPIAYGVAAVDGAIVVRTGTRLYCVSERLSSAVAGGVR
ncbi:MAG: PQQ-binding-like beta-propeller repeat protein [Planctomycetaceae bacterium]